MAEIDKQFLDRLGEHVSTKYGSCGAPNAKNFDPYEIVGDQIIFRIQCFSFGSHPKGNEFFTQVDARARGLRDFAARAGVIARSAVDFRDQGIAPERMRLWPDDGTLIDMGDVSGFHAAKYGIKISIKYEDLLDRKEQLEKLIGRDAAVVRQLP